MENKFIKIIAKGIIILSILLGGILIFSVYSNAGEDKKENKRIEEEIKYLDTKILSIINYLNNIDLQHYRISINKVKTENESSGSSEKEDEKSEKEDDSSETGTNKEETKLTKMERETIVNTGKEVDWKTIEGELEVLFSTWATVVLDLYEINVSSEDIMNFSSALDDAVINVRNKDKALSAMYIAKIYGFLPKFANNTEMDELCKKTLESKSYLVNAYAYAETQNWDKMKEEVAKVEGIFEGLVKDAKMVQDERKYSINKAYILIEELKNSLDSKETIIFYVKYKNLLEELNIIV